MVFAPDVESCGMHPVPLMRSNNNSISRLQRTMARGNQIWRSRFVNRTHCKKKNQLNRWSDWHNNPHTPKNGRKPPQKTNWLPTGRMSTWTSTWNASFEGFFGNGWTRLLIIVSSICELQVRKYSVDSTATSGETSQFWKPNVHRW